VEKASAASIDAFDSFGARWAFDAFDAFGAFRPVDAFGALGGRGAAIQALARFIATTIAGNLRGARLAGGLRFFARCGLDRCDVQAGDEEKDSAEWGVHGVQDRSWVG
jgi:hypothetical protein